MRVSTKALLRHFYFTIRKFRDDYLSFPDLDYFKSMYFSQFGEDVFLACHFWGKSEVFYVDVGAFHPFNGSNTYVFYKQGWRGINIEPNPISFRAFPKHRPRDINLNIAISRQSEEVLFNCAEERSGIDGSTYLFKNAKNRKNQVLIKALPLETVLDTYLPKSVNIDFMSVDCEGHDAEVLRSNDWNRFRPQVILVEDHGRRPGELETLFKTVSYKVGPQLGLTRVFIEQDSPPSAY